MVVDVNSLELAIIIIYIDLQLTSDCICNKIHIIHVASPLRIVLCRPVKAWFKDTLQFVVGVWGRRSRPQTPTIGEVWRGRRPLQTSPTLKLIGFELNHA